MATKIGFQLTNQPTTFDASAGLKDVLDTLGTQEKDREAQRQKWRDEQDEFFKSANDLKATPNQQANEFYGKWSGGLMSEATELKDALENGIISSRDYTAKFRNLTQSNEQMIGAQKSYQTNAQRVADGVADGSLSSINSTDFNEYNKALELGAIEVEKDGRGGFKLFNKNTGKVYNPFQLSNLTIGNIPRFDYKKAAATAVTQFGKRVTKDASGKTVKGIYANMPGKDLDELIDREAKVFVGINQARTASILVDGLGYDVVYDKKDLKENTILKNQDGTFTFTDADKAAAVNEMKTALKNALPKDVEERQNLTPAQLADVDLKKERLALDFEKLNLEKDKFNKPERNKATDLKTKAQLISTLYSGTTADINGAVDYYRDYGGNNNVLEVKRNDAGIVVTFEDENGNIQTRPVSFFTADSTSDTNVPNPDFDPSQPESETNEKLIRGRQLTEAQFVNAASQLLIAEDVSTEIKSRGDDGELLYNRALTSVDSPITATTTIEEEETIATPETYKVSADEYFDEIIADPEIDFGFKATIPVPGSGFIPLLNSADEDLATVLESSFKDIGLIATDTGSLNNKVNVRIPGVTKTITIDANNYTGSGQLKEIQKLREFITTNIKGSPGLIEKLKLKADVKTKRGRTAKYNEIDE